MPSYHLNPKTGNPGLCRAEAGRCPYGEASLHFSTKEETRAHFETLMDSFRATGAGKLPPGESVAWADTNPYRDLLRAYPGFGVRSLATAYCPCGKPLDDLTHAQVLNSRPAPCPACAQRLNRSKLKFRPSEDQLLRATVDGASRQSLYHATYRRDWTLGGGKSFIHTGTEQAAWERALTYYNRPHPNLVVSVYRFRLSPEAQQGRRIRDSGGSSKFENSGSLREDFYPYLNRYEDPGSVSALVRKGALTLETIIPLRLKELREMPSLYNLLEREESQEIHRVLRAAGL